MYSVMLRFRISEHGPRTRSNLEKNMLSIGHFVTMGGDGVMHAISLNKWKERILSKERNKIPEHKRTLN